MVKPPQKRTLLRIKQLNNLQNLMDSLTVKIRDSSNQLASVLEYFQPEIDEMKQKNLEDFFAEQSKVEEKLVHFNKLITSFLNDFSSLTSKDEKLVKHIEKAKEEAKISKLNGKLENISLDDLVIDPVNYEPEFPSLPIKIEAKVIVSEVNSPSDFYVQAFSGVFESIMKVQTATNELIDKGIKCLPNMAPGMYCVARFSEDFYWYRAKIINIIDGKVKVFFFDFGNIEVVEPSRIMPMAKSISTDKVLAVACHFAHYKPEGGWSQEAIKAFKEKVDSEKALTCYFFDDSPRISEFGTYPYYPVDIFLEDGSSFMNEISAIDKKHASKKV